MNRDSVGLPLAEDRLGHGAWVAKVPVAHLDQIDELGDHRYATFQLAEVANPRRLFAEILQLIDSLRPQPAPT